MTKQQSEAGRMVKHSTIYAIGNVSRQLVAFLMLPVYTRFLTPADYGVVGLLTFAMAVMEPLLGARLGEAMTKFYYEEKESKKKNSVVSTALMITSLISSLTALLVFLLRDQSSQLLFGTTQFQLAVGLFATLILTQAVEYYGLSFIRIQQKPILFISVSLSKLAVQVALNVWLVVVLKLGVLGVVISGVLSTSLYALGLTIYVLSQTGTHFDSKLAKRMLIFSWPLWFAGLASLYIYSSNRYYIRIFGSLEQVGLYELGIKLAMVIPLLIWQPFTQYWDVERFNYYKRENAKQLFQNTFNFISALLVIVALGISIFATPIIHIMATPEFWGATLAVPFLALGMLFSSLTMFANFSFLVTEKTSTISRNNYLAAIVITGLNLLLIPQFGHVGAALALMVALAMQFALAIYQGKKHYNMELNLVRLCQMLVIGVVGYLAANHLWHPQHIWADILQRAVCYLVFSILMLLTFWRDPYSRAYLLQLMKPVAIRLGWNQKNT